MACLILRAHTKTTCRGLPEFLSVRPSVRQELGLQDKVPHHTTLQKFSARSKILEISEIANPHSAHIFEFMTEDLNRHVVQCTCSFQCAVSCDRRSGIEARLIAAFSVFSLQLENARAVHHASSYCHLLFVRGRICRIPCLYGLFSRGESRPLFCRLA
jgi:hypothetical protein